MAVRAWVRENRPGGAGVRFVAWWPPAAVPDNPFTHEPCTLVRVALEEAGAPGGPHPPEVYSFYLKGGRVLGNQAHPTGFTEMPRARFTPSAVPE
jgi:hypothetical protein